MEEPLKARKVMAISSGGGHWVQLMRLFPVLEKHDVCFVTVNKAYACDVGARRLYTVIDATAWNKVKLLIQAFQVLLILVWERPDIVISTGAAPGYFALRFAKILGASTIWIDSIANVERLSRSGSKVGPFADLWLTQWSHLSAEQGPAFKGAVL